MISLDFNADAIPAGLRVHPHFVNWCVAERDGKPTKIPLNPRTGGNAAVDSPSTWSTFDHAVAIGKRRGLGLGFVFDQGNPFGGVDKDKCRDPQTGSIAPWARVIIARLNSYSEVSPSGTGVKTIIAADMPMGKGRRRGPVECYSRKRFFTLTGDRVPGTPPDIQPRQAELDALLAELFPPPAPGESRSVAVVSLDDADLIRRASAARNGDRFRALWAGDWSRYGSQSEADLALCALLSFWAGGDAGRVDALFRQSALCREKWLERDDYRKWTLDKATQGDVYDARRVA